MNVEAKTEYIPGDPILIRDIISQLKSQGVFDQFRKECISDVDTKPAYQNLCHRVDGQVSSYLSDIRWGPDLNKNQLRENIRKFVNECTFVEPGISRIVDQLVNPRINTVLAPKVKDIVYQYVGIAPIERHLPDESFQDSNANHKFDSQDSSFEKSWSSNSSYKRNPENESSWSRSPSKKFDNYVHSKMDSSSSLPSLFDLKVEPPDEIKEKNEDSRTDFFHSEGGEEVNSRAYSTIDSDEDNLNDDVEEPSPSFEAFDIPDACNSASVDSDYPAEIADSRDDGPPGLDVDEKSLPPIVEQNENTNTDSLDDRSSQIDTKVTEEIAPARFEVPKTPTINYETSEDSDDNNCLKVNDTLDEVSMNPERGPLADDIPDFSSVDKIAQKIAEDNCDQEKIVAGDYEVVVRNGDCDRQNDVVELTAKPKEDKPDKQHKDGEKESKVADNGAKDSKHRDRKYSEHRKDKHKSDKRDSSRDDGERKHREKERSNHDSSRSKSSKSRTESRDKTRKSSDEKEPAEDEASSKLKSKEDHKSHRSRDDQKSRDKDEKKQKSSSSSEKRSKDDKHKEKRSRSGDNKEDRKKSRHDRDRSKDLKKTSQEEEKVKLKKLDGTEIQEDEKIKLKKPDSVESKKSGRSQCGTDEKKVRTDRRSSDRDSNGPSSSSNHSHHRSTSKSDREKHSEKSRHSSSLSSTSHKSKKSDNSKSVSSDRNLENSCENSKVSTHHKEHAHPEKKKDERASSRTTCDRRDTDSVPEDTSTASGFDLKDQKDSKLLQQSHHEKKKEDKVSVQATSDCQEPSAASDPDSKRHGEVKFSKTSARPSPPKRSLVEMNSKEVTSVSNDLPGDGQNSLSKISEDSLSAFNIKKPKIARNESEFGKVVRLRKEYKEKMRLLQQQGKENNSESCQETEEKRILERLSPVPTLKEPKVVSNGSKNGLVKDLKLSITRVDSCYKIVDGSCVVHEACSRDNAISEISPVLPETDAKTLKLNIKPISDEKPDKLKLKICRSISPTSGKERTKCVQSSTFANDDTKSKPTYEIKEMKSYPVTENREVAPVSAPANETETVAYPLSENEEDLEDEILNEDDLLRQMNIEEIIGCRTDCTRISYDSGLNSEKHVTEVISAVKDQVAEKNVVLFDEDNKENVGTESQCVNDFTANRVPKKSSPEVNYFEPSSPTNDFTKFVENMIRESEHVSLLNFSIQLDYPKEYDAIFRSQLGASVNRVMKVQHFSSGNLSSAPTVSSSVANTLPEVRKETLQSDAPTNELKPVNEFSILNQAPDNKCDSSHVDQLVAPAHKVKTANPSKRKTLGIKRRISSTSGSAVCKTPNASIDPTDSSVLSRICHPASAVAEHHAKKKSLEISATLPIETSSCLNTYTHEFLNTPEITPRLPVATEKDEKKGFYSSFNNNVPESNSYPIPAKTSKKQRKNSPVRSSDELLTDIVPKRTPYKNKCYYDSSDLYKPRPSFLASSRRSRALNPDSK